jgi:hypothetical protein
MNFRNRSHIISPAAAFTLHFKGANVLGILGRAHLHLRFSAIAVLATDYR